MRQSANKLSSALVQPDLQTIQSNPIHKFCLFIFSNELKKKHILFLWEFVWVVLLKKRRYILQFTENWIQQWKGTFIVVGRPILIHTFNRNKKVAQLTELFLVQTIKLSEMDIQIKSIYESEERRDFFKTIKLIKLSVNSFKYVKKNI